MAKTVLCYGDSITWGFNPTDGSRFSFEQRWPGVLQAALGTGYRIVEEGLNGRTVATDSWGLPHRDGRAMLGPMLGSHAPLDWVIILLGTNDCGPSYHRDVSEIALAVPRCFGPCRNRLPARPAECPRCCWSHLQRSASSRRSWTFLSWRRSDRPWTGDGLRHGCLGVWRAFPRRGRSAPSRADRWCASRRQRPAPARRSDRQGDCGSRPAVRRDGTRATSS